MILLTNVNKNIVKKTKKNIKKFAGIRYTIFGKTDLILKFLIPIFTA